MTDSKQTYITTSELKSELRAMRWEVRFLIATAGLVNLGLGYKLHAVPAVAEGVRAAVTLIS